VGEGEELQVWIPVPGSQTSASELILHIFGRLRKELFCFDDDRIAVEFWYEYTDKPNVSDPGVKWFRTYGLEHWVFDRETGKMRSRQVDGILTAC
jgi:hypothetical protein